MVNLDRSGLPSMLCQILYISNGVSKDNRRYLNYVNLGNILNNHNKRLKYYNVVEMSQS